LVEVKSIRLKQLKQVETVKQEVERHATALDGFRRYSETLLSSGTACDVTRSANSLHERADELMKFDVIGHVDSSLPPANVTFALSTLMHVEDRNLVGTVTEEGLSMHYLCGHKNSFYLVTFAKAHTQNFYGWAELFTFLFSSFSTDADLTSAGNRFGELARFFCTFVLFS